MEMNNLCMGCMQERQAAGIFCGNCGYKHDTQVDTALYLRPGTVLQNYVLGRVLGHGGFGITYLGKDLNTGQVVAIKEYFPSGHMGRMESSQGISVFQGKEEVYQLGLSKFRDEANMIQQFNAFPGIVNAVAFFEANNTGYFVMEYIEGITLKAYVAQKGGHLPFATVKAILMPMMDILEEMHHQRIIHRDISPDNIYITKDKQIKLLDFGAARQAIGEQDKSLSIILKHGFAPKEQYYTKGNQGAWTDVYALAATAYYMLTGQIPQASLERVEQDALIPPSRIGAEIGFQEEQVLLTAMALKENERYQTMRHFQQALMRLESQGQPVTPPAAMMPQQPVVPIVHQQPVTPVISQQPISAQLDSAAGAYHAPVPQPEKKNNKALVLILALVMGFVVIGSIITLVASLLFGGRVTVPDLSRSTVTEAESLLKDAGLDYRIRESYETHERIGKDLIISQSPERGEKVKKNDRITFEVVISQGPAQVSVPDLFGVLESEAIEQLAALGLVVLVEYDYGNDVDRDYVMDQSPSEATLLENGDSVTLYVSLGRRPVQDLTFGNNAMKSRVQDILGISGNTITDEDVLAITDLDLSYMNISDISELAYFTNLTWVDLSGNQITDLSPLKDLQYLNYLLADDNVIEVVQTLPPNVVMVSLDNNLIDTVGDLSGLTQLESLYLYNNYLEDIPSLPRNLIYLDLSLNFITHISGLSGLTLIDSLDLSYNEIEDIAILAGLSGLTDLDISYNNITDFTAIDSIYSNLFYYYDEGNPGSYFGGRIYSDNVFDDFDEISEEIYGKYLEDFTDYNSDYYLENLEYQGEYDLYNQIFYAYYYYDTDSDEGIRIFFDEWGRLQAYYLHIWDLHYDTIGYYYPTLTDAVSGYGTPYAYSSDGLVYVTNRFIYEFFEDEYGYLTDAIFAIYRTDSRLARWN